MSKHDIPMKEIALTIRKTLLSNRDFILVITGATGMGKSTCGVYILHLYYMLSKLKFDLNKVVVFSREDFADLLKNNDKYKGILADETINMLFNRTFFEQQQIELVRMLNMYRNQNQLCIFCIPNFWNLDKSFRDVLVKMWIHVYKRGRAWAFIPSDSPYSKDVWNFKENEKAMRRHGTRAYPDKSPNILGELHFPKMPEKMEEIYDHIKTTKRAELDMKINEKENVPKCISCGSQQLRWYPKFQHTICRRCGTQQPDKKEDENKFKPSSI